jgi:hypothetical protein
VDHSINFPGIRIASTSSLIELFFISSVLIAT